MPEADAAAEKIRIQCPNCKKTFRVRAQAMGKKGPCTNCGKEFTITGDLIVRAEPEPPPTLPTQGPTPSSPPQAPKRKRVIANWQRRGMWYLGDVMQERDGQVLVHYIDGAEEWCAPDQVRAPAIIPNLRVLAQTRPGEHWYPALVKSTAANGAMVSLASGQETVVPEDRICFENLGPGDSVAVSDPQRGAIRGLITARHEDSFNVQVEGGGQLATTINAIALVQKGQGTAAAGSAGQGIVFASARYGYSFVLATPGWFRYAAKDEQANDADVLVEHSSIGAIKCVVSPWELDFDDLCSGIEEAYRSEVSDFRLIEQGRTTVAGLPAAFIEYEGIPPDGDGSRIKFFCHVFLKHGMVHQIIAFSTPVVFARLKKEASAAIQSFSFDPAQAASATGQPHTGLPAATGTPEQQQEALRFASNLYCGTIYAVFEALIAGVALGTIAAGLAGISGQEKMTEGELVAFFLGLRLLWVVLPRLDFMKQVPLEGRSVVILYYVTWAFVGELAVWVVIAAIAWDFYRTTKLLQQTAGVKFDKRVLPRIFGGLGEMFPAGRQYIAEIGSVYVLSTFVYLIFLR